MAVILIAMWEFKWSYMSILDGMDWYQDDSYGVILLEERNPTKDI
jgi:hypothetical protein